ncbi:MAG: polysaccharide deacetylase family protein [Bacteroidetes bacterium]|nr:MAG: polysaccharide deacetylase family protein [Bacteroidota bacterium]
MYLVKTPKIIQDLFPNFTWRIPKQEKVLYLTFDDGPIPTVTPWVLEQLAAYEAKATFFMVGENIHKHHDVFEQVRAAGHAIGNHTQHHLNGWATDNLPYFHDVRHCANLTKTVLFRPPYGKIRPRQAQFLQRHYRIVMWDVLSADFDPHITAEQCLANVVKHAEAGSIIVFHDSLKAEKKLRYTLPRTLAHFANLGYRFEALNDQEAHLPRATRKSA